ncbi:MAG TPA: hypothetical protein VHT30_07280 [Acidimicrobiales bacterium]|nr:hypothetical protein [Acidimicrobiales bacterium]
MARDDSAAYASNWRAVLAVDASLGCLASLVGVVVVLAVSQPIGAALIVLGATYASLVAVRARRWSRLRRAQPGPGASPAAE